MTGKPLRIYYKWDKKWSFGRIPYQAICAINTKLTDRERRLFAYYALQQSGFAPSAKEIEHMTGINAKTVYSVRKSLVRKGFIRKENESIVIDWKQVFTFAETPAKSAGITDIDNEGKATPYDPTIGELNHRGKIKFDMPLEKLTPGEWVTATDAFTQSALPF